MVKSLDKFPAQKGLNKGFSTQSYQHDVRMQVAAQSPYTGDYGLELELEGEGLPESYRGRPVGKATWVAHADGSLRAVGGRAPGGMEYVLSQPCDFNEVEPLVANLFSYIQDYGGTVQNSTRCSTHVHLNMRGMKINQICSFVGLYGTFEDVLANWCGEHRSGNLFALRLRDSEMAVNNWQKAFQTGTFAFNREQRYLALNPASLNTFGSLEVRTMRGVTGPEEVGIWVEALDRLKKMSASEEYEDPTMIAANLSGMGARGLFDEVFGKLRIYNDLEQKTVDLGENVDILVRDGFRRVQPILYALPWQDVIPETKKVFIPDPFGPAKKKVAPLDFGLEEARPAGLPEWARNIQPAVAPPPVQGNIRFMPGDVAVYIGASNERRAQRYFIVEEERGGLTVGRWLRTGEAGRINARSFRKPTLPEIEEAEAIRRNAVPQPVIQPAVEREFMIGDRVEYFDGGRGGVAMDWIGHTGVVRAIGHNHCTVIFEAIGPQSVLKRNLRIIG